jgi:hypothetical protein
MRRYLDDDVTTRVRRHGRPRGLSERIQSQAGMLAIEELTSRISSADISSVLKRLEAGFDPELDTSGRRRAIAVEAVAARKDKRDPGKPGLVAALYNWSRPRDLAHYEDFEHYHATYYRQVEALSVTPYTRRALDRGTAATFVAAVRNIAEPYSRDGDAQDVDLDGPVAGSVTDRLLSRADAAPDLRGRDYLGERVAALRDAWEKAKTGSTRLFPVPTSLASR